MRTSDGRLKILDFGLARIDPSGPAPAEGRITQPGAIIGTPGYMAPEQLNGQPADARADVFASGVLLYEYASGTHPFDATTPLTVAARILEGNATPIDERRPDLPSPIVHMIGRCLRRSPADRFASAAEIERALDGVEPARAFRLMAAWWRTHQFVVITLYFMACALAWQIKEWRPGVTTAIFIAVAMAATVAGVLRGHLLFTERVNSPGLAAELRRAVSITLLIDLLLALALIADGVLLAASRPLAAVLTIGLGIVIALVRLVVEPATTSASFLR